MMENESPWLTPDNAAAYLNGIFKVTAIREACRLGKLQHTRPGGNRILIKREWLDAWCMKTVDGEQ